MTIPDLSAGKLNFDDFYKFVVSASLLLMIISLAFLFFIYEKIFEELILQIIIAVLFVVSLAGLGYGLWHWRENQLELNKKLRADVESSEAEAKLKKIAVEMKQNESNKLANIEGAQVPTATENEELPEEEYNE